MLPKVNQLIRVGLTDENKKFPFKARIAEINSQEILIEIPINEKTGKLEIIPIGQRVYLQYNDHDLGQLLLPTHVINERHEQVKLLVLHRPEDSNIKRIQRRDFLRVPTSSEFAFRNESNNDWIIAKTIDLSGGGMQIILPAKISLNINNKIEGWLVLPFRNSPIEHVYVVGTIVRIINHEEREDINWVSIKFLDIREAKQAKIIRYCYERQMEIRKKGVIEN